MPKERLYKCWYKNCTKGKVLDKESIKVNNKRYHKDCYNNFENLKKIRQLYITHLQPSVIHIQLNKVINTLITDKKVKPELLLFVTEYLIENKIDVNAPYSLYYWVSNYRILKAYKNKKLKEKNIPINLKIYS
jgi:hypothetical protein